MKNTAKLDQLTSLRFFAALMIVYHHSTGLFGIAQGPLNLGQGVSFFFVLSGFILAFVYPSLKTGGEIRRFWLARFARIWPVYAVTMVFAFIALRMQWNGATGVAHLAMVQAWVPMSAFYFSYNGVAWSISTEAFFYLAFPLLIQDWQRTWAVKVGLAAAVVAALIAAANLLQLPEYGSPIEPAGWTATMHGLIYVNPLSRLLEFVTGMVLARFWRKAKAPSVAWTFLEVGAIALCIVTMYGTSHLSGAVVPFLGIPGMLWLGHCGAFVGFAAVVYVMACGGGAISRALQWRPLVVLGEISFSMYLSHLTLLTLWRGWPALEGAGGAVLFVATLLALSYALWRLVEMPARRAIMRQRPALVPATA